MTPGFFAQIGGGPPPEWASRAAVEGPAWVAVDPAAGGSARIRRRGPLLAAADLRLDNRDALRAELDTDDDDLGLLLAGVERWGDRVAEHLDGPFSYVVWDGRAGRASFARDRLGVRPLFRAERDGAVVLGSSLPLVRRAVPSRVCLDAVADHLSGRLDHPHKTMTAGVERVPAAHRGTVDGRHVDVCRYWSLGDVRSPLSDAEAEVTFRDAFDRSIVARLGGAPGALLSGGLDSSSVVAAARILRPEAPLPTFSIVYDGPAADERRYLDAVAAHVGVDPVRVPGEALSLLAGLDGDLEAVGEPFPTPNLFLARALYARAAAQGLDAVLDGFAGDNVVGHGDLWLTELALGLRWGTLAREIRAAARRTARPRVMAWRMVRHYALAPLARPFRREPPPPTFLRPGLAASAVPSDPVYLRDSDLHRAELSGPALPRAFEATVARASALGIEVRFPFADRALVEVCLSLPPRQRVRDGLTRSVLRRSMAGRLPAELLARTGKARLGANFEHALFVRDPDVLRALVHTDVPNAAEYLDVAAVQEAYRRGATHPADRGEIALPLWRAVSFARWLALP